MAKKSKKSEQDEEKEKVKGKKLWLLMGTGSALVAGIATTKALDAMWSTATGHKAPTKPGNPDIANKEALAWAALSGLAMGVVKTYTTRRMASYWVKSFGTLPPGMDEDASLKDKQKVKEADG